MVDTEHSRPPVDDPALIASSDPLPQLLELRPAAHREV